MRRLARGVRNRARAILGPTAIVLTYHRVADLPSDPQLLAVSPRNFAAQARMLAETARVLPLRRMTDDVARGRVRHGSIAITFDDGYADNLENAAPVLRENGLHATVFVSSGYLGGTREFWWDEAERIVLGDEECRWNVLMPPATPAQRAYVELLQAIRPLPVGERDKALAEARARFGVAAAVRPTHRPLTPEQLADVCSLECFEVGGHTRDHEVLSALSADRQRETIVSDKAALEASCGRAIDLFSYPFGGPEDFDDVSVSQVRQAAFAGACANYPGPVKPWTDRYRIPRYVVRDWTAHELSRRLHAWFSGRDA